MRRNRQLRRRSDRPTAGGCAGCGAVAPRARGAAGFSLIEVLIVILILGVLIGTVVFASGIGGAQRRIENAARGFAARLAQACEESQLLGAEYAIGFTRHHYRFYRWDFEGWLPLEDEYKHVAPLAQGLWFELEIESERTVLEDELPETPQLVCLSSGEMSEFELQVRAPAEAVAYRVSGSVDGRIELARVDLQDRSVAELDP